MLIAYRQIICFKGELLIGQLLIKPGFFFKCRKNIFFLIAGLFCRFVASFKGTFSEHFRLYFVWFFMSKIVLIDLKIAFYSVFDFHKILLFCYSIYIINKSDWITFLTIRVLFVYSN